LSGAGSFTAVISTNGEDCLQKCVDSSACQVASYLNSICQHSPTEQPVHNEKTSVPGWSQYLKGSFITTTTTTTTTTTPPPTTTTTTTTTTPPPPPPPPPTTTTTTTTTTTPYRSTATSTCMCFHMVFILVVCAFEYSF